MDPIRALLLGVVAPAVLALVLALVLGGWRRAEPSRFSATAAVALAASYVLGWALILGLPKLMPVDVTQATPWFVVLGALLAWPLGKLGVGPRVLVSLLLGACIAVWLTSPLVPGTFDTMAAALHGVAVTATFVVFDIGLRAVLPAIDPRGGAIAVVLLVTGVSLAVLFSNVASLAQVVGALAAGLGALIALGLWRRSAAELTSATLVIATVLTTSLWSGKLYAEGDYLVIAVLVALPLVLLASARWLARPRRPLLALALPGLVIVIPLAAITYLASQVYFARGEARSSASEMTKPSDDGYDPSYGY